MTHRLTSKDILALGFMTFALFVGAGNIIFPPMVGIQSGEHVWTAAIGFLLTAVGLPVLTLDRTLWCDGRALSHSRRVYPPGHRVSFAR